MLVAAEPNLAEVVAIVPGQPLDCFAKMENGFHGVSEASITDLISNEPELDSALSVVAEIETYGVATSYAADVRRFAEIFGYAHAPGEACGISVPVEHNAHSVVVLVYDVIQFTNCGFLGLLRCAKYSVGNVAVHAAGEIRGNAQGMKVMVVH